VSADYEHSEARDDDAGLTWIKGSSRFISILRDIGASVQDSLNRSVAMSKFVVIVFPNETLAYEGTAVLKALHSKGSLGHYRRQPAGV
jgi:hypothetical protein